MTERSYFHNSTALGHASEAPYGQELYASLTNALYGADGAWVLPNQLNNLLVSTSANMVISIDTGRALIYGYWFYNSVATTLTITNNSTAFGRWDLVVAQVDTETGVGSFIAIPGAPGAALSIPACNTCATIKQLPLALIYVEPSAAAIHAADIYDQRMFLNNAYHRNNYSIHNEFPNGLFIGWADSENTGAARQPMPGWRASGTAPVTKDAARFDSMPYGRCVNLSGDLTSDGWTITVPTYANSTDMMTFSMALQINSGTLAVSFAGTSKTFYACHDIYHVIFHISTTGNQVVSLIADGINADISFGDLRLAHGYCEPIHSINKDYTEVVMFDAPVLMKRNSSRNNYAPPTLVGLSDGDSLVTYYSMFGSTEDIYPLVEDFPLSSQIKAIVMQIRANDSGSSGAPVAYFAINEFQRSLGAEISHLRVDVHGAGNDKHRYATGIVYSADLMVAINDYSTLQLLFDATGATTLDGYVAVIGVLL